MAKSSLTLSVLAAIAAIVLIAFSHPNLVVGQGEPSILPPDQAQDFEDFEEQPSDVGDASDEPLIDEPEVPLKPPEDVAPESAVPIEQVAMLTNKDNGCALNLST